MFLPLMVHEAQNIHCFNSDLTKGPLDERPIENKTCFEVNSVFCSMLRRVLGTTVKCVHHTTVIYIC